MTLPAPILARFLLVIQFIIGCPASALSETEVSDAKAVRAIHLPNPAGQSIAPLADQHQQATVLFFLTTECPIGNAYAPEVARIVTEYQARGILCYAIYADATSHEVARHLKEYKLPLVGLLDPKLQLVALTGATVMPEACVFNAKGEMVYRGRIDDRVVKLGTVRAEPRQRDLRLALDAVLANKPVAKKFTKAIGCYLPTPSTK